MKELSRCEVLKAGVIGAAGLAIGANGKLKYA